MHRPAKPLDGPELHGYAAESFVIGPVLHEDRLDDQDSFLRNWRVQQSQADPLLERYARIEDGRLHVHAPRGCSIWFTEELEGPVLITYKVRCPSAYISGTDIVVRDVNQFWMANAPHQKDPFAQGGLFDHKGYFGFRMTQTHHVYRDFRVYRLNRK